jgi:hypothetical protein
MKNISYIGELHAQALAQTLLHVEEFIADQGLEDAVVAIVAKYEGVVEPEPFVVVEEPLFVERRKSLVVVS